MVSDLVLVALIAAVPATIAAVVSIFNGRKSSAILVHVNSEAEKSRSEIAALRREIELMRGVASEKRETAALLAQAVREK